MAIRLSLNLTNEQEEEEELIEHRDHHPHPDVREKAAALLKMHRFGSEWEELHARVNQFLSQFSSGSTELLRNVGLLGDSKLALACKQT